MLGKGSFARVVEGLDYTEGTKLAVKIVDGKQMSRKDLNRLLEEIRILQLVSHPNIISLQASCFIESLNRYYLMLEHMEGGELFDQIIQKTCYTEREAKNTAFLLLDVLSFLHDRAICHRDLKVTSQFVPFSLASRATSTVAACLTVPIFSHSRKTYFSRVATTVRT